MSIAQRLGPFTIVGLVAFVVGFCLFNILSSGLGADSVGAKILSVAAATGVSWAGSRYFSYRYVVFRPSNTSLQAITSATSYATGAFVGRAHA